MVRRRTIPILHKEEFPRPHEEYRMCGYSRSLIGIGLVLLSLLRAVAGAMLPERSLSRFDPRTVDIGVDGAQDKHKPP